MNKPMLYSIAGIVTCLHMGKPLPSIREVQELIKEPPCDATWAVDKLCVQYYQDASYEEAYSETAEAIAAKLASMSEADARQVWVVAFQRYDEALRLYLALSLLQSYAPNEYARKHCQKLHDDYLARNNAEQTTEYMMSLLFDGLRYWNWPWLSTTTEYSLVES